MRTMTRARPSTRIRRKTYLTQALADLGLCFRPDSYLCISYIRKGGNLDEVVAQVYQWTIIHSNPYYRLYFESLCSQFMGWGLHYLDASDAARKTLFGSVF